MQWRPEPMHGAQVAAATNVLFDYQKSSVAIFIGKPIPRPDRVLSRDRHAVAKRWGNGKARVALARKLSVILHSVWRSESHSAGRSTQEPPDWSITRFLAVFEWTSLAFRGSSGPGQSARAVRH
jgi:hypothetical protein